MRHKGLPHSIADRFAAIGEERLTGVGSVDADGLVREDGRGERAHRIGPGGEEADRQRGITAVVHAHVSISIAVEFDDPRQALGEVGRELVVVDGLGAGDEERVPAGVVETLGKVALVVVDEKAGSR